MGYGGWTSSHGLWESERRTLISKLARDPEDVEHADAFGVQFVCLRTRAQFGVRFPVAPNSKRWKRVYSDSVYNVYERTRSEGN
jgi:hypothetical protein